MPHSMLRRLTYLLPKLGYSTRVQRMLSTASTTGSLDRLAPTIRRYVEESAKLCRPDKVHVCDGSEAESQALIDTQLAAGRVTKLAKLDNCYLAITSEADVARVESKTYICMDNESDAHPIPKAGVKAITGNWRDPQDMRREIAENFNGCMQGRTMYVIPYSMGPVGSPLSKIGIQLTDSEYVVSSMRIMTRIGQSVLDVLGDGPFVKCLHSVGYPLPPGKEDVHWPCNPEKLAIAHFPANDEIVSFGSGYGGNSLLGKKCFALRIASNIAHREGWLAEHMLIVGITNPEGEKKYFAAAFPSQCGKTNLAMMMPSLPGWKIECVGDDIAWMKFDDNGVLHAINPENGFFGVAPGTNHSTNPNAMACLSKDTIFTNVAYTSDGGVYWEGLEDEVDLSGVKVTNWLGQENWTKGQVKDGKKVLAAHSNARFCTPAAHCPVIDPAWEDAKGVPISGILFGGRRPTTVPLVFEAYNWNHGVYVGSTMRSEATSAAEFTGKAVMHDPFAMRPFFGYSFAQYVKHWLSFASKPSLTLPKIFHVNWFRKGEDGKFLWPGFGENSRALEWIFRRCDNEDVAQPSPFGLIPTPGAINTDGLDSSINDIMPKLFEAGKKELTDEADAIQTFYEEQLPQDLPPELAAELQAFRQRIADMK